MITFDDYLRSNVERRLDRSVRESDLYTGLKHYCRRVGVTCPTWQEYHRLLKERQANKVVIDGRMLITGISWKDGAEDRPMDAQDYLRSESVAIEEKPDRSGRDNEQPVVLDDSPPWAE